MNRIKQSVGVIALCVLILFAACKKHNDVVAKPALVGSTTDQIDTVTVGDTLKLHPQLMAGSGITYSWTVGGQTAGTDSVFSYIPTGRGDFAIVFTASNAGGSATLNYKVHVYGKYENGFFVVNEGNYASSSGQVNFFRYNTQQLETNVYLKENPGKTFDPNTTSLEFGTVYNNKLYLLTKGGGPLVAADAFSLKETGRIAAAGANDFRALLGIDTTKALVSTGDGIYPLNLQTLTLGAKIAGISGEIAEMKKSGNYIFIMSANDGVDVLKTSDYSIAKTVAGAAIGLAVTPDGAVWAAGDSALIRIDPTSLAVSNVKLPFEINGTFGFWHQGSITASTKENTVFIGYNLAYSGATGIYKYSGSAVTTPFINIDAGKELYGSGISYDASRNQLVVTTVKSGYGANSSVNDLVLYDAGTGAKVKDVNYTGYYFPALTVFH